MTTNEGTPANSNGTPAQGASGQQSQSASETPTQGADKGAQWRSVSEIPTLLAKHVADQKQRAGIEKAYWDRNHPEHAAAVDVVARAYGAEAAESGPTGAAEDAFAGFKAGTGFDGEDTKVLVGLARESGLAPADLTRMLDGFRAAHKAVPHDAASFEAALTPLWGADVTRRVEKINAWLKENPAVNRWVRTSGFGNDPRLAVALWSHVGHVANERGRLQELRGEWSKARAAGDYAKADRLEEEMTQGYTKLFPSTGA